MYLNIRKHFVYSDFSKRVLSFVFTVRGHEVSTCNGILFFPTASALPALQAKRSFNCFYGLPPLRNYASLWIASQVKRVAVLAMDIV
jgi:hypothetical protein